MTRAFHLPLLCLLWLLTVTAHAASTNLLASVDRTRINSGETIELTLESNDATQFGKPDMSVLDADFEVHGTRQLNRLTTLDGSTQATTRWIVTLMPKRSGTLEIPALTLGEAHSTPITLQVTQAEPSGQATGDRLGPVFIDASVDEDAVYVQAQIVLTLRIYHSVSLFDDSNLSALQVPEARVEKLGEARTYEKLINGVRHGVIEIRYAIYPQQSGSLTIPPQTFSATQVDDTAQNADPNPFGPRPGRTVRVTSAPIPITVKPQPADYPPGQPWLPARTVTLEENWSPEPGHSQVGDSLTRILVLKAEGLSSAQLPPLPATEVSGLRRYPDQPQLANLASERGLIGSRQEREALVPARGGDIPLPTVDVVWWNTREDHLEHTSLPARTLAIRDNPSLAVEAPVSDANLPRTSPNLWLWQLSTVLLSFTTLLGFGLWWRGRWQPAVPRATVAGPSPRTVLDDLKRACAANDPQASRQALDAWARQQPETLADMAARFVPLSDALDGLNGALYSEAGKLWLGEDLWLAVKTLPPSERTRAGDTDSSLPPLYPK